MPFCVWLLLAQVSPGPWDEPLAPALGVLEEVERIGPETFRPSYLQSLGAGAYDFYKATLSSAKGSNCQFAPSCSAYGIQSIRRLGLMPGLVLFASRMMRGHINFDRFYRFDGVWLLDPLEETLAWLHPEEEIVSWQRLQRHGSQSHSPAAPGHP